MKYTDRRIYKSRRPTVQLFLWPTCRQTAYSLQRTGGGRRRVNNAKSACNCVFCFTWFMYSQYYKTAIVIWNCPKVGFITSRLKRICSLFFFWYLHSVILTTFERKVFCLVSQNRSHFFPLFFNKFNDENKRPYFLLPIKIYFSINKKWL